VEAEWLRTGSGLQYIRFLYSIWAWDAYASSADRWFRGIGTGKFYWRYNVTKLPTCGLVRDVPLEILAFQQ
jgi:hypothetical protein